LSDTEPAVISPFTRQARQNLPAQQGSIRKRKETTYNPASLLSPNQKALADYLVQQLGNQLGSPKPFDDQWVAYWPEASTFPSGIGLNIFNLINGKVLEYNNTTDRLNQRLEDFGLDKCRSLYFWNDGNAVIRFGLRGVTTGEIASDAGAAWSGIHIPFDTLSVRLFRPGAFQFVATTSLEPWQISATNYNQMRYNTGTTTNSFSTVAWQAVASDGSLSASGAQYVNPNIRTAHMAEKTFLIINTDPNNALDVNVQGQTYTGSSTWVNDPSTSDASTVNPGHQLIASTEEYYTLMRLRIRASVSGSQAAYEIHYGGRTAY
jgi:hypothetical protein